MTPLRIALVGAGSMAAKHAAVVTDSASAQLHLVIDRDPDRAAFLAKQHGAASANQLDEALTCDTAIVATCTPNHRDAALTLLAAGIPVLVEKPLAMSLVEVNEVVDAAHSMDAVLMCGFVERFNSRLWPCFDLAGRGITEIRTTRVGPPPSRPVHSSVINDLLLHDLDLVLRMVGDDPLIELDVWADHWNADAAWPEAVTCQLTFASGATAFMHASRVAPVRMRSVSVRTDSTTRSADLTVMTGNPLAAQFNHLVHLARSGTPAARAAERGSIVAAHALADRVESLIGVPACTR